MAVSHGVLQIRDSKTIPMAVISRCLRDVAEATEEIARRLEDEAKRRAPK